MSNALLDAGHIQKMFVFSQKCIAKFFPRSHLCIIFDCGGKHFAIDTQL